jgi:hypothetical protein
VDEEWSGVGPSMDPSLRYKATNLDRCEMLELPVWMRNGLV